MNHRTILLLHSAAIAVALFSVSAEAKTPTSQSSIASVAGDSMTRSNAGSVPMSHLVGTFSAFAGSTANAQSLVEGLRTGTAINLVDASNVTTTFTPATHAMGWGNVKIALALAQAQLAKAGITNPTPADIEAVLNGGTITNGTASTTFTGVLVQRASGLGWGQIAHAGGLNLGRIVSAVSKPVGVGKGHVAMESALQSGKGVVAARGSASGASSHNGKASTGMVTAGGDSVALVSTAKGHASVGAMTTGNSHAVTSSTTTAAGSGSGGNANRAHGKGNIGG